LRTSATTGLPVAIETPQSPRTTPPRKSRYWNTIGWSRPSFWRMASMLAALACSPSTTEAGSPGSTRTMKKTSVSTANSVMTAKPILFRMKAVIVGSWIVGP
jgi:hypothetical protein